MEKTHNMPDKALIEACIGKDMNAWALFVKRFTPLIRIAITNRLKKYNLPHSSSEVDDIQQNVLMDIWNDNKLSAITNIDGLKYWLAIVSGNAAISHCRRSNKTIPINAVDLESLSEESAESFLSPASIHEDVSYDELRDSVMNVIRSFSPKEQVVVQLNLFYGKRHDEIARITAIPEGTVSSYIKRAKDKIKARLKHFD